MLVLPTYVPLPDDGMVKSLLVKVAKRMKKEGEAATEAGGGIIERAACESIKAILSREKVASREYFGRAWTLAERVARFGRGECLCKWLSLPAWLGMVVDAILKSERLLRLTTTPPCTLSTLWPPPSVIVSVHTLSLLITCLLLYQAAPATRPMQSYIPRS
jgi:hypothetical protein